MKSIKIVLLFFVIVVFISQAKAQFGIRGGFNSATVSHTSDGNNEYNNYLVKKAGFHFGLSYQIPLCTVFSFEPALLISNKGYDLEIEEVDFKYTEILNSYYLELPLNLKAAIDIKKSKVFIMAGPYIAMGIDGSIKVKSDFIGSFKTDIHWGSEESDQLKRIDFGVNTGIGIEFNPFVVSVNYSFALINSVANPDPDQKDNIKNRVWSLSLGYNFGKKDEVEGQ